VLIKVVAALLVVVCHPKWVVAVEVCHHRWLPSGTSWISRVVWEKAAGTLTSRRCMTNPKTGTGQVPVRVARVVSGLRVGRLRHRLVVPFPPLLLPILVLLVLPR
jgi:hypothetical protein